MQDKQVTRSDELNGETKISKLVYIHKSTTYVIATYGLYVVLLDINDSLYSIQQPKKLYAYLAANLLINMLSERIDDDLRGKVIQNINLPID